jgi:6,7-dimethyl-8-ribityllumazine synthase|tara:strand:+ start:366 stop:797 length:432 start_codon:yes stop_codon:yes gene_type:complete
MKIAIVASQFNKVITDNLIMGAKQKFTENSFSAEDINIYIVPGAFEIPSFIKNLIDKNEKYDAIIAFGSVIKGETAHFEYISNSVTDAIMNLSVNNAGIPILYGILTTYNYDQALERSLVNKKDKGGEVMQAAIDFVNSINKL